MSYERGYGGRPSRVFKRGFDSTPVEVGKEYDVDITGVSRQGDGITKVQGFIIFVKGGKPGQKVKVQVNRIGNRFAVATIVK